MSLAAYGGGTDSTAMLIGLHQHSIPLNLILFADMGCGQPHFCAYWPTLTHDQAQVHDSQMGGMTYG